jgi:hypothetical protein
VPSSLSLFSEKQLAGLRRQRQLRWPTDDRAYTVYVNEYLRCNGWVRSHYRRPPIRLDSIPDQFELDFFGL